MKSLICTLFFFVLASSVFATQDKKTLKLRLQSPSGNLCDATLYFDNGISPLYDVHEDAQMVFNNVPGVPEFYSFTTDNVPCSINGCGTLSAPATVALGYHVGYSGTYTISTVLMDNFDPTSIIRLYDKQLGTTIDLRENFYQVQLDSSDLGSGRFSIQISTPVTYSYQPSNCDNNGGKITVTPDTSITWSFCQLYDSTNHLLMSDSNVAGPVTFNGLSAGTYHVLFTYNQYSYSYSFYLAGNFVVASIGVPGPKIYTNEDVVFNGIATNANHFTWDFGDGTLIDGVDNPDQTYLLPGTYTVNLTCSNDLGCSASATATITVYLPTGVNDPGKKDISVMAQGKTVMVNMNDVPLANNPEVRVYNLLGQTIITQPIFSAKELLDLNEQTSGYYIVSIKNAGAVNTKRIFIGQ